MPSYVNLLPGDPAPTFRQRTLANPRYAFDTAAGRYLVLLFHGSAGDAHSEAALAGAIERLDLFDDCHASFFGVSVDPADEAEKRVAERYPGYRHFLDFDGAIAQLYGALPIDEAAGAKRAVRRFWIIVDPGLHVLRVFPFQPDRGDIEAALAYVASLPPPARSTGVELQAPVILLPNVLEAELCAELVAHYETIGGEVSGFMRQIDGKTVLVQDPNHKRRRDCDIVDRETIRILQDRVRRRIVPEIAKVHQFHVTRMERYIVACYLAEEAGHFQPHRDNTTSGTAHRRFAVSINLNSDFEGGEIYFPEYGPRSFKPPVGGAVIFSCSLLHAVTPVTAGKRYAFLPFLYDDAAAKQREANNPFLADGLGAYNAGSAAGG